MSRLDDLVSALAAAPEEETRARALYAALAGTELCLLLAREATGDTVAPKLFPLETGPVALAFDSEERLTVFSGPAPFVALSGRALADMLAPQGIGLGLNLGTPGEYILPSAALDWLSEQQVAAQPVRAQPVALHPPEALDEVLMPEIEARLASAQGLAQQAVLAQAEYADGTQRPLIGFIGAREGAERGLSALMGEVLSVAGRSPESCDIAFVPAQTALADRACAVGLLIEIPQPPPPPVADPSKPPKLR